METSSKTERYKVSMQAYGNAWTVMDDGGSEKNALKALKTYREFLPDKKFRLEKHTIEVLDD